MTQPKAYLFGFELETIPSIKPADLFTFLVNESGTEFEYGRQRRLIVAEKIGQRFCGMLITSRTDRMRAIVGKDDTGAPKLNIVSPKVGTDLADINFFMVNPKAHPSKPICRGVYLAYRGSCSTTQFGKILSSRFSKLRQSERRKERDDFESSAEKLSAEQLKANREALNLKYPPGPAAFEQLVDDRDFENRLQELAEFDELNYSVPAVDRQTYGSGRRFVETERRTLKLSVTPAQKSRCVAWLTNFFKSEAIPSGSVTGKSAAENVRRTVRIDEDVLSFASIDHDDVIRSHNVRLTGVADTPIVESLSQAMDSKKALFGERI
ncbi:hypothetical protein LOC71_22255 [Rhodopirellula sp. JC740]|uniref:Uncharacterized protein n=1 Tax=Rhodopirellula halodulae TaxID=2894198 RepID=A0ABS8NNR2_9BACT|nr:hypothetical protein [Rhodopirellula sp. JC740]MCC9645009.1 hypothetical protein [Rhodopirellula sp. JC740]